MSWLLLRCCKRHLSSHRSLCVVLCIITAAVAFNWRPCYTDWLACSFWPDDATTGNINKFTKTLEKRQIKHPALAFSPISTCFLCTPWQTLSNTGNTFFLDPTEMMHLIFAGSSDTILVQLQEKWLRVGEENNQFLAYPSRHWVKAVYTLDKS